MRSITPQRTGIFIALALASLCNLALGQNYRQRPPQQTQRIPSRQMDSGRIVAAPVYEVESGYAAQPRSRVAPVGYVPQHTRVAQSDGMMLGEDQVMSGSAVSSQPMVGNYDSEYLSASVVGGPDNGSCNTCGSGVGQNYFSEEAMMDCGGCGDEGCTSCFSSCDRGGCPPDLIGNCWIGAFSKLLYRAEYFAGAQGFTSPSYAIPGRNDIVKDCGFGFNAGVNVGVPLCRLTCGLLSGQMGVRSVNSEFSGTPFSSNNRDQVFVTTGVYRRVDNGLQFGVVGDFLFESWYTNTTVVQVRGDLGWVYAGGNTIGVRFAENVQDDVTDGVFNGTAFTGLVTSSLDNYRIYYRQNCSWGGYSDVYLGWSDEKHVVGGMDYDVPMGECWALQSSFTYYMPENERELTASGGNANEAWNVAVGLVFRPQGRAWYRNYDRPILPVADNGSMVMRRRF